MVRSPLGNDNTTDIKNDRKDMQTERNNDREKERDRNREIDRSMDERKAMTVLGRIKVTKRGLSSLHECHFQVALEMLLRYIVEYFR